MKKIEEFFDRLHSGVVQIRLMRLFTAFVRPLLALAFIPPSIPKITHQPFTSIPRSNPIGAYFGALYDTGFYYDFLGWSQLAAALLLLIPRTSHLGALLFFPIILNITVLTNSVGFKGTWLVTILMSLACLYLVCWEYPKWKSILFFRDSLGTKPPLSILVAIVFAFTILPAPALMSLIYILGIKADITLQWVGTISLVGLIFGILVALHFRFLDAVKADSGKAVIGMGEK